LREGQRFPITIGVFAAALGFSSVGTD